VGLGPHRSAAEEVEGPHRLDQETKAGAGESFLIMSADVYPKMPSKTLSDPSYRST